MRNVRSYLGPALLSLVMGGCAVTSDYEPPPAEVPQNWLEQPADHAPVAQSAVEWWSLFHDAELDSLIVRAVAANLDVRLAHARLLEARAQSRVAAGNARPTLNAKASYLRERDSGNAPAPLLVEPDGTIEEAGHADNLFQAGLDASWELDIFGGQRRSIEASRAAVDVGKRPANTC